MDHTFEFDWQVRRQVYEVTMQRGYPPSATEIASALDLPTTEVQAGLQRLAGGRALVLQPGSGEILMANPFSAVPTPFLVELSLYSCYGNCIWDAMGIAAMLKQDAHIKTTCGDCGTALELSITEGNLHGDPSVVHFAIPAHHWWDDIVFS
jgi:hypothetical protein